MYYRNFNKKKLNIEQNKDDKTINIYYNDNDVIISTPKLKIKNKLNLEDNEGILRLELPKKNDKIYKVLTDIDTTIVKWCAENSSDVFDKTYTKEQVEDFLKPSISYSGLGNSGTILIKVFPETIKVFDRNTAEVNLDNFNLTDILKQDSEIRTIIRLLSITIKKGFIKAEWILNQVKVKDIINDCQIIDSESEPDDDKKETPPPPIKEKIKDNKLEDYFSDY